MERIQECYAISSAMGPIVVGCVGSEKNYPNGTTVFLNENRKVIGCYLSDFKYKFLKSHYIETKHVHMVTQIYEVGMLKFSLYDDNDHWVMELFSCFNEQIINTNMYNYQQYNNDLLKTPKNIHIYYTHHCNKEKVISMYLLLGELHDTRNIIFPLLLESEMMDINNYEIKKIEF